MSLFAAYLALGLGVGFLAGLLGVGGGLVIVPVLIVLFHAHGIGIGIEPQLALGTSLGSILFTSLSSVRAHHRHGAVEWPLLRRISLGIVAGTLVGGLTASHMPAQTLKIFFVVFLFFAASQMALDFKPPAHRELPGRGGSTVAGVVIGAVSSWVGIGGGTLSVPFLLWHKVPLHRAIATAAAIGFPIAAAGAVAFIAGGWNASDLPPFSLGFLYLPALVGIVTGSVFTAPLGARTAHRMPLKRLRQGFAILLFALALRMLYTL